MIALGWHIYGLSSLSVAIHRQIGHGVEKLTRPLAAVSSVIIGIAAVAIQLLSTHESFSFITFRPLHIPPAVKAEIVTTVNSCMHEITVMQKQIF